MIYQTKAEIVFNQRIRGKYFHCFLRAPKIAQAAQPGQFVQIRVADGSAPLLRRPFSIAGIRDTGYGKQVEILYGVIGEGSRLLSQKREGEFLDIIGPLGNGFDFFSPHPAPRTPVLVAGGMGVAPLVFLAERIAYSVERIAYSKPLVLLGAKTVSQLLCEKEFKALGCEVKVATDDGSKGFHGRVTDLLMNFLSASRSSGIPPNFIRTAGKRYPLNAIYACGPHPMLKAVAALAKQYRIPAQVSLEAHMACGIGACLGCVVETIEGYKRVCQEGPVFPAQEVVW
jgi:dihydroorotate dehydrogenase electron transfer subunit